MPDYIVTGPNGAEYDVTAPEGASQDEILSRVQQYVGQQQQPSQGKLSLNDLMPPPQQQPQGEPSSLTDTAVDYASDIGQSLASGAVHQGVGGLVGLPHALGDLGDFAEPWAQKHGGNIGGTIARGLGKLNDVSWLPSQQDVSQWIGQQGYEEYDPKTYAGSAAKAVGEWVPFVAGGPAGIATRTGKIATMAPATILRAAKMAALTEAGGQAGRALGGLVDEKYKNTGEIVGRMGAAIVGGIHSGSKVRGAKTIKQYEKAINNSYARIRNASPTQHQAQKATNKLFNQVKGAESNKALGGAHESVDKIMNNWRELVGINKKGKITKVPSGYQIMEFEKQLNPLKGGNAGKLAYKLESTLDDLAYHAGGTQAKMIRQDFAALKKKEFLEDLDEIIRVNSGGLSGGGAQAIRIKFTQLWRQMHPTSMTGAAGKKAKRIQAMFSPKERRLIKALADPNGFTARKMMEVIGKEGQNRVALSLGLLISIGMGNFAPLMGAAALRTGGGALKGAASWSARSKFKQLESLQRGGHTRPIYNPAAAGVGGAVNRENKIQW
jgi:hypothetical protein